MRGATLAVCFAAALALAAAVQPPLLPPRQRVDASAALEPLHARRVPDQGEEFVLPPSSPSPTSIPLPVPVNVSEIIVGNDLTHRTYMDFPEGLQIVFPGIRFPGQGTIKEWEVYTGRDCNLELQVLRSAPIPKILDSNNSTVTVFNRVGSNFVFSPALGSHTFKIEKHDQIQVEAGDVMGVFTSGPGCISWSDGGPATLFRYGKAGHNELHEFGGIVFIGDGVHRTYSVSASGTFKAAPLEMKYRISPTASPSRSASLSASPSPTISPSHSTSVSSVPSMTRSVSPTPSLSMSNSISLSPSPSPSTLQHLSDCAKGVVFWCATRENMHMCNVTEEICERIAEAAQPVLPSTIPSISGSISPSISVSPSFQGSPLPSPLPSTTPSPSFVVAPYLQDSSNTEGSGLSPCHYCNGGSDWTGGMCLTGQQQSPVSLKFDEVQVDAALDLYFSVKYNISRAIVGWNDYAFTISGDNLGSINIDGVNYDAEMAMIRAPSEHKIEGQRTPMELQIFHRERNTNPPRIVAVAVLFEETAAEVPALDWMFSIPPNHEPKPIVVDLENFLSDLKPLAFYNGSMTMPPCQEGVLWGVSMANAKVSYSQMQALNAHLKGNRAFGGGRGNNRMLQPLNGRQITLRSNCGMSGSLVCNRQKASAQQVPESMGGSAERADAAQKEVEMDVTAGGEDMFDDGDVKLW